MNIPGTHIVTLSYADGSGLRGAWGPYRDEDHAKRALDAIKSWPCMEDAGTYNVLLLLKFDPDPQRPVSNFRRAGMMDPDI